MLIKVEGSLNYLKSKDINVEMKEDFYKAKKILFDLGYDEYIEIKSLPINPKQENAFSPLATYRVKDSEGNYTFISIYFQGLGGAVITDEF